MRSVPSSGYDKCCLRRCHKLSKSSFSSTSAVLFWRNLVLASCLVRKYSEDSLLGFLKKNFGIVLNDGFWTSSRCFCSSSSFKNCTSASRSFSAGVLCFFSAVNRLSFYAHAGKSFFGSLLAVADSESFLESVGEFSAFFSILSNSITFKYSNSVNILLSC